MGQTSPRREKAPSRPHPRPVMWYLSSWRNLPWRSNAGHGLLNKPEITPPSHSNHRRDGTPATSQVALGPLINQCQIDHAQDIVDRSVAAGAKLEAGGTHKDLFFAPTVLSGVVPGMAAFEEEVFGPVAPVTRFETDEEAITLANQTEYGLSAGIISRSVTRALGIGNRLR